MSHDISVQGPVNTKWTFDFLRKQYSYLLAGSQPASHEGLYFMKLVFYNFCCPLSAEI
jgi:hypothetical protein